MNEREANLARYYFEAAQLAADTFEVVRFRGHEAISQLFRYELELVSRAPDIDFSELVNHPATFTMMRSDEAVPTSGLVSHFEQAGRTADYAAYRAVLVPRLWRLSLSYQSRIFQNQTVEEILRAVLEEAGLTSEGVRFELSASYAPREYCVQYQETDLNFLSRLLEHEGICYFFEQGADGEVLVMTDDRGAHPQIGAGASELRYQEDAGMVGEQAETAQEFICREQVVTGKVMMKDYNYRTPETKLQVESQLNGEMPGTRYEYGEHFQDADQGQRLAKVRNEEIECRRRVMRGASDCAGLRSGHLFTLAHHYRGDLDGDYLLTRVEHEGSQAGAMNVDPGGDGQAEASYQNRFTCIPSSVQYRPRRQTPKPEAPGLMTARVESAGGDYAYINDQGEYRAKLDFDCSDRSGGTASKPIRMKQAYSGPGYGIHFPNHQHTEMIVACVNGDIDRPLALGTAPNPSQASPAVAGNKMQNVIRTWGQNELTFDDTKGGENIYLHGTKDWTIDITNDKSQTVGSNETLNVGSNRDKTVGANQTETVGGNKTLQVSGNHSETIAGTMSQTVQASKSETITVAKALSIGAGYQVSVGGAENHTVGGLLAQEVGAAKAVAVGAASSEDVGLHKSVDAGANISESAGKNFSCSAGDDFTVQAGKKVTLVAGDDVAVSGKKKGVIDLADQLTLKCGNASITLKKNGDILINGKKIQIKGSGNVVIKGKKVLNN